MNIFTGSGKIIKLNEKEVGDKFVLEIIVSVYTKEKKKEGEQYAPQNIFQLTLWEKFAETMCDKLAEQDIIMFSGMLGKTNVYLNKNGEPQCVHIVQSSGLQLEMLGGTSTDSDSKSKSTSKSSKTTDTKRTSSTQQKSKSKTAPAVDFDDADVDDSTSFFDDL